MEKYYLAALSFVDNCGHSRIRVLLNYFKSAENIWRASAQELLNSKFLSEASVTSLLTLKEKGVVENLANTCTQKKINIVTYLDDEYPDNLKAIVGFPTYLFYQGKPLSAISNALGIVGPRKSSKYGQDVVRFFVEKFAGYNMSIISGGARGIDTVAHKAALEQGLHTVAVLGCGLDINYPRENSGVFAAIAEHGTVVSEYPPGVQPLPRHFPARNRIISGLSRGVLLAEAGEKSGSLITADFAMEQGREVYCAPGSIFSDNSFGVHHLIQQGAKLTCIPEDILEDYFPEIQSKKVKANTNLVKENSQQLELIVDNSEQVARDELSDSQQEVLKILEYDVGLSMDAIHTQCDLDIGSLNLVLLELEILGYIHMDISQRKYLKIRGVS